MSTLAAIVRLHMYDYLFKHGLAVTSDSLRRSAASLGLNHTRFDR